MNKKINFIISTVNINKQKQVYFNHKSHPELKCIKHLRMNKYAVII